MTALQIAAYFDSVDVVQYLCDSEGSTPLTFAKNINSTALGGAHFSLYAGSSALMVALLRGSEQSTDYLIDHQSGIENQKGQTALMIAAATNNVHAILRLIPLELQKYSAHASALIYSAIFGRVEATQIFLELLNSEKYKNYIADMLLTQDNSERCPYDHALSHMEKLQKCGTTQESKLETAQALLCATKRVVELVQNGQMPELSDKLK